MFPPFRSDIPPLGDVAVVIRARHVDPVGLKDRDHREDRQQQLHALLERRHQRVGRGGQDGVELLAQDRRRPVEDVDQDARSAEEPDGPADRMKVEESLEEAMFETYIPVKKVELKGEDFFRAKRMNT